MDSGKTLAHKRSPISDCDIKRTGKPHDEEQETQAVTRKLADPVPSFNTL